jgi:succinyl-CoA synthetase alpha subunit
MIDGIPFGFANAVRRGTIGMIASSGTGAQQVSCLVDKFGHGVSQLIGTGGRDLKEKVGGIMTLLSIDILEADPKTQVITIISKGQPGPSVMKALCARVKTCKKPVVAVLLGADGTEVCKMI